MNKKNILILVFLFLCAIFFSIIFLKVFKNVQVDKKEENTKVLKDFIDIDNSKLNSFSEFDKTKNNKFNSTVQKSANSDTYNNDIDSKQYLDKKVNNIQEDLTNKDTKFNSFDLNLKNSEEIPLTNLYSPETLSTIQEILNSSIPYNENAKVATTEDLTFLSNIMTAADDYVLAYDEAQSFILTNDLNSLKTFIDKEFSTIILDFASIDSYNNQDFEKIKSIYLEGMTLTKEGFKEYINNPQSEDCNSLFLKADDKFYEGQQELKNYLESYNVNN